MDARRDRKASRDHAAVILQQVDRRIELTPENNARVLRLIDLNVLPVVLGIYFLQALDKATLAYASVFNLAEDANLHGRQYSWLGAVVYLAQLVAQPLIAYCLVRLRLGKFLAFTVLGWGITLSCMTAANTFAGLLVTRMLLGFFEAGVAPAFIAVTQMWWRRREQPVRLSAWYAAMNGITNMVGSLLTYGLGHINSPHLKPYQIIFLFFGVITVAYAGVVFMFMPDSPLHTKIFKTEEDRLVAIERLRANQQGIKNDVWKWDHAKEAALDLKTWLWAFMMFSISVPSGGISTFGPLIIKDFGFNRFNTILLNIPFGAVQLVATLGGAWVATKLRLKSVVLIALSLPPIVGCVMLLVLPRGPTHRGPLLAAFYLISVYPGITPLIYSWSAANTAGETKKKVTTASLIIFQCAGNVVGPNLYTTDEAPKYARGLLSNLALFIVLVVLYAIQVLYLIILNKKHGTKREEAGKSRDVVDESMQKIQKATGPKGPEGQKTTTEQVEATDKAFDGQKTTTEQVETTDKAFDDRTDWQNEDFVYVY
ncbi:hypothetical protein DV735_g2692, partial [Chaetothyriales sp. CBS 134920]